MIEIPKGVRFWKRGSCVPIAMLCAAQLEDERDLIIEGYIRFRSDWQQHTWMEIAGETFDPTFIQFYRFKGFPVCERTVTRRMKPSHYIESASAAMLGYFCGIHPRDIAGGFHLTRVVGSEHLTA